MEELRFDEPLIEEKVFDDIIETIAEEQELFSVTTKPKKRRKKVTRHYINNEDFCNALIEYKDKCSEAEINDKPKPIIPNYIGECFIKLAEGLARKPNFYSYSYKDEMIADSIENCLMTVENFNPEKTKNPFAYFTQIIFFCFLRRIQAEKKQQYIKYKSTENFGILDEEELMELGDGQIKQIEVYDNMYDFIKKFEEFQFKKISKVIEKKQKLVGVESYID